MSYIKHLAPEDIKIEAVEHSALVAACSEVQDIMELNPAYDPEMDAEQSANWLSEAMDEACVSDSFSDETMETLRSLGYVMPGDPDFMEDSDGKEEVDEAAEVPQEAEGDGQVKDEKPVKGKKSKKDKPAKEPKAKKEPKPKKEKAPKEPKPKKEKAPKAPGVIETLRGFVKQNGEKGFTIADAHKFICEKFPEREKEKLLATCRVQLQQSRMGNEIGYTFTSVQDTELKCRVIHATPTLPSVVPASEAAAATAEEVPAVEAHTEEAPAAESSAE